MFRQRFHVSFGMLERKGGREEERERGVDVTRFVPR